MIEITRTGKNTLVIENPVMPAAGTFGFDSTAYNDLIDLTKLGAIVTNPITWKPRRIAHGINVIPLPSGVMIHTGVPNPGMQKVLHDYAKSWAGSLAPVIVHVLATTPDDVARCAGSLEGREGVVGIELGLHDQVTLDDINAFLTAVEQNTMLPVLVRVPLYNAVETAQAAEDFGAGAVVVANPPRGTTRDPETGQLVGGRIYGPWLKVQTLRAVGQVARAVKIPVIGSGGIHTPNDARDFLEAGAVAVQVDTVVWSHPRMIEIIARNLGGLELTRVSGALADEWEPGIGITMQLERNQRHEPPPYDGDTPAIQPPMPPDLPD
ncbi:MAG: nitronate monooxygenase [Anaerolineae bacterium]|nr:nitronate monooxygenase [Anaerolineae bacterium]